MKPRVIGIDASRIAVPKVTGTERYAQCIVEHLLQIATPFRFRLFVRGPLELSVPAERAEFRVIPFPRLWTHVRLAAELVRHPVDLLFVPAHVLPVWCPVPGVVTVHDLGYRYEPEAHPLLQRLYLEFGTLRSVRQARRVIAISQATARDLVRFYRVPPERIAVVPHGVDRQFSPRTAEEVARVRERYGLHKPFLLHVGTLQPRKNLVRLIRAFERVAATDHELELILAGKRGWLAEPIETAIRSSPVRQRIRVLGHVVDSDLPALYSAAELFVFPSLYEGFGLPVLEAMACGIPVVTSRRGALAEIAGPAITCDPLSVEDIARAIAEARDPVHRPQLVRAGLEHAKQFTWERSAHLTLDVLAEAIGTRHADTVSSHTRREDR
ncbi:glycosyltransferase family 1 protein [Thermomicrobium sp. 4228-Ro]|uniref:glycosyltransferase family 4 protein n=1 Tax=Thermomicrobium sp. 4228-Ro TaxID=2993937 RepID=UPI0022499A58|nr:glycosyltransferase family 1 protein [Thermomicrobium sp. 4228-Ro]MCX2726226.1 glycosyltransferase family 1 protein [Thermomicrobium sp. 4228-Ro]